MLDEAYFQGQVDKAMALSAEKFASLHLKAYSEILEELKSLKEFLDAV